MNQLKQNHRLIWQFLEYLFSGGVYFVVGYILLDIFYYSLHWNLWWSTIVSSVIGWLVNYALQRYWVFANEQLSAHKTRVSGRYAFITIVDFLLNYFILWALRKVGITPAIGQFISAGFFTGWNYIWYRFWVFPSRKDEMKLRASFGRLFFHRAHGHSAYIHHG